MIGIVVVSHSYALATAAVDLAAQMLTGERPAIAVAAGLDETTFGTDAAKVSDAIQEVDSPDGVLVLLDLGSAVLSADLALEFLDDDLVSRVRISPAPLVEGLVAAVVTAASGAPVDQVAREAEQGLAAKQSQLSAATPAAVGEAVPAAASVDVAAGDATTVSLVVPNRLGLHARPAAAFVQIVTGSPANVTVTNVSKSVGPVDASSLTSIATLDARGGDELRIVASGEGAADVVAALLAFRDKNFGDDDSAPAAAADTAASAPAAAVPAAHPATAPRAVTGPLTRLDLEPGSSPARPKRSPQQEWNDLATAIDKARAELTELVAKARRDISDDAAEMVAAQLVLLDDRAVMAPVRRAISEGTSALAAWDSHLRSVLGTFDAMPDPYMRARGQDITSLRRRVSTALTGAAAPNVASLAGVLLTDELDAPTAVQLDSRRVKAVVTQRGGSLGHGVMVAKARGIALFVDRGGELDGQRDGATVTVAG